MRITPVASQPNFCAKLKNNNTLKEFMQLATTEQLKELRKNLEELDKYNKKDILEIKRNETNDGYDVTNLSNKKTVSYKNHPAYNSYSDDILDSNRDWMWNFRKNSKSSNNPEIKYTFLDAIKLSQNDSTLFGDLKSQYMNSINSMLHKGRASKDENTKLNTKV